MTPTNRGASSHGSFAHEAFLFASEDEWVRAAVRHLRAGRDAGEHLVIACHPVPAARIVTALGRGPEVTVRAADDAYSGPIPMAQAYLDLTRRVVAQGATGVRVAGQLPAGTEYVPHTWPGWARYEAVVNHVLGPLP